MDQVWRQTFTMHSETESFQELLEKTKKTIDLILSKFKKPYIAYSGGKDSCVLLDLILHINPKIIVFHWDYGPNLIPRIIEYRLINNAFKIGAERFIYVTSDRYLTNQKYVWYKDFLDKELPKLSKAGFDLSFIGLRAEESIIRAIKTKNILSHDKYMCNAFPLRDWTYRDVYAYLLKNKIPYLEKHYDKYSKLMGYDKSRFVTFHDPEFSQLTECVDGILMYKHKYDDIN